MTKTLEQIRIAETVKVGENSLKLFKVSGDRRLDQNQNNIEPKHLPRNFEESYKWLKYLFDSEVIKNRIEYIIENGIKTKDDILNETMRYLEVRYRLKDIDHLIREGKRDFWATKEKCWALLSNIGFDFKNVEKFDNKFLRQPVDFYELERFYLVLASIWDFLISNFEKTLENKLKSNGIKHLPGYFTNQILVSEFFLRNFEVMNKYTEFFKTPLCPDSLKYYKGYVIITFGEHKMRGNYGVVHDEKAKKAVLGFMQMFVKPYSEKPASLTKYAIYDILERMSQEIYIPWGDDYLLNPKEEVYRNIKTGNILAKLIR